MYVCTYTYMLQIDVCVFIERVHKHKCSKMLTTVTSPWSLYRCSLHCLFSFSLASWFFKRKRVGAGGRRWCLWRADEAAGGKMSGWVLVGSPASSITSSSWVMDVLHCFGGTEGASVCDFSFLWAANLQWSEDGFGSGGGLFVKLLLELCPVWGTGPGSVPACCQHLWLLGTPGPVFSREACFILASSSGEQMG